MRPRTIKQVVSGGLCSGCGLCAAVAGPAYLRMKMSSKGFLRPNRVAAIPAQLDAGLIELCPGATVRIDAWREAKVDPIWGGLRKLARAYATDPELRHIGSSGGVLTALAGYLLTSGKVEFVLDVAALAAAPMRSGPHISTGRAGLLTAAGARYGPVSPLVDIMALLDRGRPFAVIAKPCDIAGLRNLARRDPRVDQLVRFTMSFFCGGVPSLAISQRMIGKYGLVESDVRLLRYRGHGCPGPTRIETHDGRVFEQSYDTTWNDELNQDIQFRCKICADAVGQAADIAVGDAWETGDGSAGHQEHDGWNTVIIRSARGEALFDAARHDGVIESSPLTRDVLDRVQPHHVERKRAVLGRLCALTTMGQPAPRYRGLAVIQAGLTQGLATVRAFIGTLRRLMRRANRERATMTDAAY